jgi:hypothetical protein
LNIPRINSLIWHAPFFSYLKSVKKLNLISIFGEHFLRNSPTGENLVVNNNRKYHIISEQMFEK